MEIAVGIQVTEMWRSCLILLCSFVCLTNEVEGALKATSEPQVCTSEETVSAISGRNLSLIARVDDDEECYFVFQAKNKSVTECCYGQDCDPSEEFRKCLPEDQYSVSTEYNSKITKSDICRLDIFSVNETNSGRYKIFTQDHQSTVGKFCHVQINTPDKKEEGKGEDPKDKLGKGAIVAISVVSLIAVASCSAIVIILLMGKQSSHQGEPQEIPLEIIAKAQPLGEFTGFDWG